MKFIMYRASDYDKEWIEEVNNLDDLFKLYEKYGDIAIKKQDDQLYDDPQWELMILDTYIE